MSVSLTSMMQSVVLFQRPCTNKSPRSSKGSSNVGVNGVVEEVDGFDGCACDYSCCLW